MQMPGLQASSCTIITEAIRAMFVWIARGFAGYKADSPGSIVGLDAIGTAEHA
jgi:hypothetical protein